MAQQVDLLNTLITVRDSWEPGDLIEDTSEHDAIHKLDEDGLYSNPDEVATTELAKMADVIKHVKTDRSTPEKEFLQLSHRFGGIVNAFAKWNPAQDKKLAGLENALTLAANWNADGRFWEVLALHLPNPRLVSMGLAAVISVRQTKAHVRDGTPIFEQDALEKLHLSEREGNFGELMELAHRFPKIPGSLPDRMAVQGLHTLDRPRLIAVADRIDNWFRAAGIVDALPLVDAIRIATETKSSAIRFAVLERAMHRNRAPWNSSNDKALRNLFLRLATSPEWPKWLEAFNRYPVRCGQFQRALGQALARMNLVSLEHYIHSLELRLADQETRELVEQCLIEFRSDASLPRRVFLWKVAYEQWDLWNFEKKGSNFLNNIHRSALDFAVLGHLIESHGLSHSNEIDFDFEKKLKAHEMKWHSSHSEAISDFYRLLSRHQVFALAKEISRYGNEWKTDTKDRYPNTITELVMHRYKID